MADILTCSSYATPIGPLVLVLRGESVLICEFADRPERVDRQLARHHQGAQPLPGTLAGPVKAALDAYFAGAADALDTIETAADGTAFERRVWQRLRRIATGTTCSYGALALELASSPRAVGRANGRNPVALIHPCHRVVGADGSLTGYAGGLARKDWLLKHERAL